MRTARQSGWVGALTWADDTGRCRQRVVASARGRSEIAGKLKRACGTARVTLSYGITADIYRHINIEQQCEAADLLGEAFVNGERRYCSRRSPGPARSHREPLTCGSVVGLAGFEPATP